MEETRADYMGRKCHDDDWHDNLHIYLYYNVELGEKALSMGKEDKMSKNP